MLAEADPVFVALPFAILLMIGLAIVAAICGVAYLIIHLLVGGRQPKRRIQKTGSRRRGSGPQKPKRPMSPAKKMLLIYLLAQVVLLPFYCIFGGLLYSMGMMDPEPEPDREPQRVFRSGDTQ